MLYIFFAPWKVDFIWLLFFLQSSFGRQQKSVNILQLFYSSSVSASVRPSICTFACSFIIIQPAHDHYVAANLANILVTLGLLMVCISYTWDNKTKKKQKKFPVYISLQIIDYYAGLFHTIISSLMIQAKEKN